MNKTEERPEFVTDDHLEYLDELRESGVTNMYGAGAYIEREFELSPDESRKVVTYWMHTFNERHAV
jgi:hypothetical protein